MVFYTLQCRAKCLISKSEFLLVIVYPMIRTRTQKSMLTLKVMVLSETHVTYLFDAA
jgi:hypothetical protein